MLSERLLTTVVRSMTDKTLALHPVPTGTLPDPVPGRAYTLYVHVPFCERLCPYCSFNRYPYREERARTHFKALREEMRLLAEKGYDFESAYIGGGTPTVDIASYARPSTTPATCSPSRRSTPRRTRTISFPAIWTS